MVTTGHLVFTCDISCREALESISHILNICWKVSVEVFMKRGFHCSVYVEKFHNESGYSVNNILS